MFHVPLPAIAASCHPLPPASMTINPAPTTPPPFLLFRLLGRPRRNRHSKSFRSHYEVGRLVMCGAVRMHGHGSHIHKCWASEVGYTNTNTEYPPTHTHLDLLFPRRRVTAIPACKGESYLNHHVISASDHQWPVFRCQLIARTSYRHFQSQSSQTRESNW
jgi:hypothetical protein